MRFITFARAATLGSGFSGMIAIASVFWNFWTNREGVSTPPSFALS
jgi:hypothetical protein